MNARKSAMEIEQRLRAVGTPERAEGEKRYLKSDLDFLGASVGDIRRAVATFVRDHPELTHDELLDLVETLWAVPIHERRMAAAVLPESYVQLLSPHDLVFIEGLIREARTWALVDVLAGDVVGRIVLAGGDTRRALDRWARDEDFWVRRSALLAWLRPLKAGADFEQFGRYADRMLEEREFFIRKGIGWVLRETAKRRPDVVWEWLHPRLDRVSGVTLREGVKYLDEDRQRRALDGYAAQRRAR